MHRRGGKSKLAMVHAIIGRGNIVTVARAGYFMIIAISTGIYMDGSANALC